MNIKLLMDIRKMWNKTHYRRLAKIYMPVSSANWLFKEAAEKYKDEVSLNPEQLNPEHFFLFGIEIIGCKNRMCDHTFKYIPYIFEEGD